MQERKRLLLLVEENEGGESLSLRAVQSCGVPCEVNVAPHGVAALSSLFSADGPTPDLVVLDFQVSVHNRIELLRELRRQEKTRNVPIVLLGSIDSPDQVLECIAEGASSVVRKPADPAVYMEKVALVVRYWLTVDRRKE